MQPVDYKAIQTRYWLNRYPSSRGRKRRANEPRATERWFTFKGAQDADDPDRNDAGLRGKVGFHTADIAADVLEVTFGTHVGSFCGYADTVLLYSECPYGGPPASKRNGRIL